MRAADMMKRLSRSQKASVLTPANLKTEPLMDPLRKEPRFQAIVRELKFPS